MKLFRKKNRIKYICLCVLLLSTICSCKKNNVPEDTFPQVDDNLIYASPAENSTLPVERQSPGIQFNISATTPCPEKTDPPPTVPAESYAPKSDENQENTNTNNSPSAVRKISNEKYSPAEGIQTVAWISDTQHYANTFPEIYPIITSFLYDHKEELNLVYVVHTGDLVHYVSSGINWQRASEAMSLLKDIPYGVLAGNHDIGKKKDIYANYWKYFGENRFNTNPWFGASYENNRGHYDLISIGETDYIFVYMSFQPDDGALQFIKDAFDRYPERIGILCLHDFIMTDGTISPDGKIIKEKILQTCSNCYFVLCGHRYGFYCLQDSYDDDHDGIKERTVYEIMANYQAVGKEGGSGYIRLLQFDDKNGKINMLSYSPYLNDYNWLDDPGHREPRYMMDATSEELTLDMPWRQ